MGLGNIGISGLILVLVVLLLFFGPSKLPEIGKAFGKSLREFKDATRGMMDDDSSRARNNKSPEHVQSTSAVEAIELKTEEKHDVSHATAKEQ